MSAFKETLRPYWGREVYITGSAKFQTQLTIRATAQAGVPRLRHTSHVVQLAMLQSQIQDLRRVKWLDLYGLITCVTTRLSKASCSAISLLGRGSYNTVYKLTFSDAFCCAVSVPNADEEYFDPSTKQSEIATMLFVKESGLYPDIPIPHVYIWDLTFTNPAGAPYVVLDYICGILLSEGQSELTGLQGLDAMSPQDQLSVVKCLAKLQASLSKPVPFAKIGSLTRNDSGSFEVGELITITGARLGGPYTTLSQLWRTLVERQILHALEEWHSLETDQLSRSLSEPYATPQQFSDLLQRLSALIPYFIPPNAYTRLVLHHPDLALRNILFDPTDHSKIVGVLDWGGAQILPLMLTAHFPPDLHTEGDDPCPRPGYPDERWRTIPHDWTSFGDSSSWTPVYKSDNKPVDLTIPASAMVKRYYLRQSFGVSFAERIAEMYNDCDLARAMLFADAAYYLKFHEVMTRGWVGWVEHASWIKETYWRLHLMGTKPGMLLVGPNTYHGCAEEVACDLGLLGSLESGEQMAEETNDSGS